MLWEQKAEDARHSQRKLESQASRLHKEIVELDMAMECLNKQQDGIEVLSQIHDKKTLVKESLDICSGQYDQEFHLSELQEEKVLLTERISGLEAVLRYMTKERESSCLALRNSDAHALSLQDKIKRMENEIELHKIHLGTTIEVENQQRKASETDLEKERKASEDALETNCYKTRLEAALEEVQGKVKMYEIKLEILQIESEAKVLRLVRELAASKQNQEIVIADYEKIQKMLEDAKANEEKLDNILIRLELKLKASEYERQKLAEEVSRLKIRLQNTEVLQDEVFALRKALCVEKTEKQRLEASFHIVSGDYEELKTKRVSYAERISNMEKAMSELGDCKHSKAVLEEKIMQLEWDLVAREALRSQIVVLKNELGQIRTANNELQRRIRHLKREKSESSRKVQALEEELREKIKANLDSNEETKSSTSLLHDPAPETVMEDEKDDQAKQNELETFQCQKQIDPWSKNFLENEFVEALDSNNAGGPARSTNFSGSAGRPISPPVQASFQVQAWAAREWSELPKPAAGRKPLTVDEAGSGSSSIGGGCGGSFNELMTYLSESLVVGGNRNLFDLVQWWRARAFTWSVLTRLAMGIFSIIVSTISSEQAFSTTGRILEEHRNALQRDIVEALVCIKD
ncbi:Putative AC transposase [Morus notabilis]|uniref:Putative AC transposase n=1 Tax=Morus notabilis TaxID=981085 RepID=W9QKN9_9ROSA|nr:Putative AC transposase [Morus notabilis]